jgi:WD40 repeat protein
MPLGWHGSGPLYLVASATDTSLFTLSHGGRQFLSILMPQVITSASLSPPGSYIAFAAPANCFYCTYDVFNLDALHSAVGPSGGTSERDIAWFRNGRSLAVPLKSQISVLDPVTLHVRSVFPTPPGLPRVWSHSLLASVRGKTFTLTDTVTGKAYRTTR